MYVFAYYVIPMYCTTLYIIVNVYEPTFYVLNSTRKSFYKITDKEV